MLRLSKLLLLGLLTLLTGCASTPEELPDRPIAELYASAQQLLQEKEFREAIKQLEAIDSRYPYGPYTSQVHLDLLYAYYQAYEWALAQTMSERFMRLNSTHPQMDYVLYLRALTALAIDDNALQRLCNIDRAERDNQSIQQAFQVFKTLIVQYPNSPYAAAAWRQLLRIKNYLARYELAVANHYHQREAYVAVANRVTDLLTRFPDTLTTRQALPLLQHAYQKLKRDASAKQVERLRQANPPVPLSR
ncbi:MAG: outer membrane protein assembly factor BamD [Candidatus Symbiodolus clandestinus]